MKKLLLGIVVLMLVAGNAWALDDISADWVTYEINNTSTTDYLTTVVDVSIIRPNIAKLCGWTVQETSSQSEAFCAVYDTTAVGPNSELLGESEAVPETVDGRWFVRERKVLNAITVCQGPNSKVLIYYTNR